jgi:iron(III) transport system ATP-binding protein
MTDRTADAAGGRSRVEVRGLGKSYGAFRALDDIQLDVGEGEFVVLLGPSGCGKTTLLRCIAGLETADTGEILLQGETVFSSTVGTYRPPERRGLSMVFQSYALWPHMTVAGNVGYPLENRKVPRAEIARRVAEVLRVVGLDTRGGAYPGQLSGGQQQRVALARAIVTDAGLVLFDEPLSNLDAKVRENLRGELLTLQRQIGFAAVYVTHDQVEAMALADRVVVMDRGRIAQVGTPRAIYDRPATRYVAGFVGSQNELAGEVVERRADGLVVETAMGRMLASANPEGMAPGRPVHLLFRPEHAEFADPAVADTVNLFPVRLERTQFLGTHAEHTVLAGTTRVVVRANTDPAGGGAPLHLRIPADRAFVFAREG